MSLLEIKQQICRLSPAERRELNVFLLRLRQESAEGRSQLSQIMREMDAGAIVSMDELEQRLTAKHGEAL
jgi:hypothetical protein